MSGSVLRWLRPSVLDGAWTISRELAASPGRDVQDAVRLLRTTYSSSGFDFEVAAQLLREVTPGHSRAHFYRAAIGVLMAKERPSVLLLLPQGRDVFCEALDSDALECFRRCGALDCAPIEEVVRWLDELATLARAELDAGKLARGREAERKSFEWEQRRLNAMTDAPVPTWVSLDNNSAGYDIRSFEPTGNSDPKYVPRFIEVKASTASRPQFYLSRGEIRTARLSPDAYFVHVWHPDRTVPLVIPWLELNPHIPSDTMLGQSTEVLMRWPSW